MQVIEGKRRVVMKLYIMYVDETMRKFDELERGRRDKLKEGDNNNVKIKQENAIHSTRAFKKN